MYIVYQYEILLTRDRTEPNLNQLFEIRVEPNRTRTEKVRFVSVSDTLFILLLCNDDEVCEYFNKMIQKSCCQAK